MNGVLLGELEEAVKDKELLYEYFLLREIDILDEGTENPFEIFKNKLIEKDEKEFLDLLIKNNLI